MASYDADAAHDAEMDRRDKYRDDPATDEIAACATCGEVLAGDDINYGGNVCHLDCAWDDASAVLGSVFSGAPSKASMENLWDAWDAVHELMQVLKDRLNKRQREEWRQAAYRTDTTALKGIVGRLP